MTADLSLVGPRVQYYFTQAGDDVLYIQRMSDLQLPVSMKELPIEMNRIIGSITFEGAAVVFAVFDPLSPN